jgi:carbonic anhydrase
MTKKTAKAPAKKKKNTLSAAAALKKLKDGNGRYLSHAPIHYSNLKERADFSNGQKPYAAILSCADSRVSPEIMFNVGLDEVFVIRVAGNIADTTSIASIEYAVAELNTNLIVVLGHEGCGAVNAALANADGTLDLGYNLNALLAHISPAVAAAGKKTANPDARLAKTVKANAKLTAKELRTRSPIIAKARGVKIVWGYYHLIKGKVDFSDFM